MKNIITKIEIDADSKIELFPSKGTTLITGFSGKGKTLLFKLIVFALGESRNLDITEAQRHFPGLKDVKLTFSNNYVFERNISENFYAEIKRGTEENFVNVSKSEYKQEIGALFEHENVKVLKSSDSTVTFTVSEYFNTLFFDENRITDDKSLIEAEGYADKVKLKNYYKYFLTNKILDEDTIKKVRKEKKDADNLNKAFSYLGKQVSKPTSETKKKRNKINAEIRKNIKKINDLQIHIEELNNNILAQSINKNKLLSLNDLYNSQLMEIQAASELDGIMETAQIQCPHCKEMIKWEPVFEVDEECNKLGQLIADIQKTIALIDKKKSDLERKLISSKAEVEEIKVKNEGLEQNIVDIDKQISDYSAYEKLKKMVSIKAITNQFKGQLDNQKKSLDDEFIVQIKHLCDAITKRLTTWKITTKVPVDFDYEKFDFTFNGTIRYLLPKGYRGFCTVALIIELMRHMKSIGVPCFDFILVDTVWKVASFEKENINDVVTSFLNDIAECELQIIVFENENIGRDSGKYEVINLQ